MSDSYQSFKSEGHAQEIQLKRTPRKKIKFTYIWYVVQIFKDGEWIDIADNDFTKREARSEMVLVNCYGHKARMIERAAGFRVVAEKDFSNL